MLKKSFLLISLVLIVTVIHAQDNKSKQPCFRVSSFSTSLGFGGAFTSNSSEDYYALKNAVENPDLFIDITGMSENGPGWGYNGLYFDPASGLSYSGGGSGNANLLFNLGLTPYSKKLGKYRDNREFRISLGGSFGSRNNFYYYDDQSFTIDTLQSINGNSIVYADSSIIRHYNYTLDFSEVNIGFSYLFKTDVNRRWHFYTGVGFNYGITLQSKVEAYEDVYRTVYYYDDSNKPSDEEISWYNAINESDDYDYKSTETALKNPMMFGRIYIPLGVELKLSKKPASFFNNVDLYAELNPGVEFQILPGEKTYTNPYVGFAMIGIRYHW